MAEKKTIVQNSDGSTTVYVKPDVIGIVGEIVGCIGGLACGGFVGMKVAQAIGPVTTTIDKVGKAVLVGSAGMATEYYVSEGISGTFNDMSEVSDAMAERIKARSQKILVAAASESDEVQVQTKTKK